MNRSYLALALSVAFSLINPEAALSQTSPGLVTGQVPTAAQWNSYFAAKQDTLGFVPLSIAGGTMTGRLVTSASSTARAGLSLPAGTAPTSPVDGDMWTTTVGVFARIDGVTQLLTTNSGTSVGGDLVGTLPNPVVAKINTNTLGDTTPGAGNFLIGSGALWASRAITGDISFNSTGVSTLASGSASNLNSGTLPIGRLPALIGDVTSSAGSNSVTVAKVNGVTISGTPAIGYVPQALNATTASWQPHINNEIDVFVLGGQSNDQGTDALIALSPAVPSGVVLSWDTGPSHTDTGSLVDANDPRVGGVPGIGGSPLGGSPWPHFGIAYYQATGRRVLLVPAAKGGSVQATVCQPMQPDADWDATGTLRAQAVTLLNQAITAVRATGLNPIVRGMLWKQGEEDAGAIDATTCKLNDYKVAYPTMATFFRGATVDGRTFPTFPIYFSLLGAPQTGDTAGYQLVRQAQQQFAEQDPYTHIADRTSVDFPARDMMQTVNPNTLHYYEEGYAEVGRNMAKGVVSAQSNTGISGTTTAVTRYVLGGTVTSGDTIRLAFTAPYVVGTPLTVEVNVTGLTLTQVATSFVTTMNNFSPALTNLGIYATSGGATINIYVPSNVYPGPTQTPTVTGAATETFAAMSSGTAAYAQSPNLYYTRGNLSLGTAFGADMLNIDVTTSRDSVPKNVGIPLGLRNDVAVATDNWLLRLVNGTAGAGATNDLRAGILFQPGYTATSVASLPGDSGVNPSYGSTIQSLWESVTGRGTIAIGGFAVGVYAEHARFPFDGGLAVGTTSSPGLGLIYTNSASFMLRTKTSLTNGAAAQTGTLTNAPAAGNPTKWLPYDDNGTTRYIPAW